MDSQHWSLSFRLSCTFLCSHTPTSTQEGLLPSWLIEWDVFKGYARTKDENLWISDLLDCRFIAAVMAQELCSKDQQHFALWKAWSICHTFLAIRKTQDRGLASHPVYFCQFGLLGIDQSILVRSRLTDWGLDADSYQIVGRCLQ